VINIQRVILKSYLYASSNEYDLLKPLEKSFFDVSYRPLIEEINNRIKYCKDCLETLEEEYIATEHFDIDLVERTKPVIVSYANEFYKQLIASKMDITKIDKKHYKLRFNYNTKKLYERIVVSCYIFYPQSIKLIENCFSGLELSVARLINKLIDKDAIYKLSDALDNWGVKQANEVQQELLEIYAVKYTQETADFYYSKLKKFCAI
jgi:hypothetical protein